MPSRLSDIYAKLGEQERRSLLDYAEFLLQRQQDAGKSEPVTAPAEPELHPRPESESVVAAIKRLTRSYPMLEKQALFSGTSELMSAHLLQGRDAEEIIDELEALFEQFYRDYVESFEQDR
ncbi:MAG: hypothetical protein R3179_09810 [Sedimenticolaceae bacterium]|nr:hypothetical protein [Sedimenticolaceae bacterium]